MRRRQGSTLPATLTAAQQQQVEQTRQRWLDAALSTAPADRAATERAVSQLYGLDGHLQPRFVWVGSPAGALLAIWLLAGSIGQGGRRNPLRSSFKEVLADPLWEALEPALRDPVWAGLREALGDDLVLSGRRRNLLALDSENQKWRGTDSSRSKALRRLRGRPALAREDLSTPLGRSLTDPLPYPGEIQRQFRDQLEGSLRAPLRDAYRRRRDQMPRSRRALWLSLVEDTLGSHALNVFQRHAMGGQFDADRCCLEDLLRGLGLLAPDPVGDAHQDLFATIARSCGPWWPYAQVCIMTERPAILRLEPTRLDGTGAMRLHCPDGPALAWRDGLAMCAWHGTRVPGGSSLAS